MRRLLNIWLLIGIMSVNLSYAQTNDEFRAEEFIAEVFFSDMTEENPKIYLEKQTYLPFTLFSDLKEYKAPNSRIMVYFKR